MKPQELRIGNYVLTPNGEEMITNFIKSVCQFNDHDCWSANVIKPIPLKEEWLLNFGFEKIVFDSEETGYGINYVLNLNSKTKIVFEDDMSFGVENSLIDTHWLELDFDKFEGVHELQNLYYVLTKKELTLTK